MKRSASPCERLRRADDHDRGGLAAAAALRKGVAEQTGGQAQKEEADAQGFLAGTLGVVGAADDGSADDGQGDRFSRIAGVVVVERHIGIGALRGVTGWASPVEASSGSTSAQPRVMMQALKLA